jgi:hypothetical protein
MRFVVNARIEAIRYLASREAQERYIINGTASEYLLPEELVNDAREFVRLVELGTIGSSLTRLQRNRLAELKIALEAVDVELPNAELVSRTPAWADVREAAQRFVAAYDDTADRSAG